MFRHSLLNGSNGDGNSELLKSRSKRASMSEAAGDKSTYSTEERGSLYTLDYRLYFKGPNGYISPWHDIPLCADKSKKIYNMIVEIPRWTNAKMEICTKEAMTPIKQDIKNGAPRFVHNVFPHHGYIWNYGALPQTWENPEHINVETKAKGDNDPVDVVEIGTKVHKRGDVVRVKLVGVLALIDDGETDWKLVAIDVTDPKADVINRIRDVDEHFPGLLHATHEWFRLYKVPAGKSPNKFGFNGQFKDVSYAQKIVDETHEFWEKLIKQESPALNTEANVEGATHEANQKEWEDKVKSQATPGKPAEVPPMAAEWHFLKE